MKASALLLVLGFALASCPPANAQNTGFPFTDEDLNYSVNWPSGLSLGEAHMHAKHSGSIWNFELNIDASVPGFQVKDTYRGNATNEFCSTAFDRITSHGSRKTDEKETISVAPGGVTSVKRTTAGDGGESQFTAPGCVKDALTLLYYARRELGQGRVPPAQQFLFGGLHQIRLDYAGAQIITIAEAPVQTDKVICTIKTATGELKFEAYFARDPARTPLLFKSSLAMGFFLMELVR